MKGLREALRAKYMDRAAAAFDELMEWEDEHGEARLLEIEEIVGQLGVNMTQQLVEAVLALRRIQEGEAGVPECRQCGKPMHYKGEKRKKLVTTAGEVELRRSHYHCKECQESVFPPGREVEDQPGGME